MLPTLLKIGPINLSAYGVFVALAFLMGTFFVWRAARDKGIEEEIIFDNVIVIASSALLGARLVYIFTHWSIFSDNILKTIVIWRFPGLSVWGAVVASLGALYLYSRKQKANLKVMFDSYGYATPVIVLFMSIGVFLDGTVTGKTTAWFTGLPAVGVPGKHHPIGLYGAGGALIMALVLALINRQLHKSRSSGIIGWTVLSMFGGLELLLAIMRENLLYWGGISPDYIVATILFIGPLGPLFVLTDAKRRIPGFTSLLFSKLKQMHLSKDTFIRKKTHDTTS